MSFRMIDADLLPGMTLTINKPLPGCVWAGFDFDPAGSVLMWASDETAADRPDDLDALITAGFDVTWGVTSSAWSGLGWIAARSSGDATQIAFWHDIDRPLMLGETVADENGRLPVRFVALDPNDGTITAVRELWLDRQGSGALRGVVRGLCPLPFDAHQADVGFHFAHFEMDDSADEFANGSGRLSE